MTELALLSLVRRYPHRTALARRSGRRVFAALGRLEVAGLVVRRTETYRLTARGELELDADRRVARIVVQALRTKTSAVQPSSVAVSTWLQPEWRGRSPSR